MFYNCNEKELILKENVNLYDDDALIVLLDNISSNVKKNPKFGNNHITNDDLHIAHASTTKSVCDAAVEMGNKWLETYFKHWEDSGHAVVNKIENVPPYANREGSQLAVHKLWGYKIVDGFEGVPHNHWPHMLTFVYYMDASDPIYFPYLDLEVKPEPGLMLMFRGNVFHQVKVATSNTRYVLAGSLQYVA
jgi:hypothetical protein